MSDSTPEPSGPSRRNWISLGAVLIVQTQNAFNDNFVKFALLGLAVAVAGVSAVGKNIEHILAAMIPIPFILLAPVAGYLSDRFSKRNIIAASLVAQLLIFILIGTSLQARFVYGALIGYFLLAVQSTIFSPAKMGILKELVGSSRLGMANGLMQMLTMAGILGGMFVGGQWFDSLYQNGTAGTESAAGNAWRAALIPTIAIGLAAIVPLILIRWIEPTPSHPATRFSRRVWVRHFVHLGELMRNRILRLTALSIGFYWFVANFTGLAVIRFGKELNPDTERGGASSSSALMMAYIGIGLILGSVFVSILSNRRIRLDIVPLGIVGIAIGLLGVGLLTPDSLSWNLSLGFIGFSSGFFLVPLNAFLQDRASEGSRGRMLSAMNLLNSFAGVVSIGIGLSLSSLGWLAAEQVLVYAAATGLMAAVFSFRVLKILRQS